MKIEYLAERESVPCAAPGCEVEAIAIAILPLCMEHAQKAGEMTEEQVRAWLKP